MRLMTFILLACMLVPGVKTVAQPTFPVNGTVNKRSNHYIFNNAYIHLNEKDVIYKGYLEIKNDRIVSVGSGKAHKKGAVEIDLEGLHIYPSFIDLHSDYGIAKSKPKAAKPGPQIENSKQGAFAWNEAIKSDVEAAKKFVKNEAQAKAYRQLGFGAVLSHQMDGIYRGTGCVVSLSDENENFVMLKPQASAHLSFNKGSSRQSYPSSLMGSIALLRQTYLDAEWYKNQQDKLERNLSLEAFLAQQDLPQFFDAGNYLNELRANRVGDEFGKNYIIKGRGDEYLRIDELTKTDAKFIVPLHFPKPIDPTDPDETMLVTLKELKHWELAPGNPAQLEQANLNFALTSFGMTNKKDFLKNLRKAVKHGLSKEKALAALTTLPASFVGMEDDIGSLKKGSYANFIIVSDDIFNDDAKIYENWIQGKRFVQKEIPEFDIRGEYDLKVRNTIYKLKVTGTPEKPKASFKLDTTTVKVKIKQERKLVALSFDLKDSVETGLTRLSGQIHFDSGVWDGTGIYGDGSRGIWHAVRSDRFKPKDKKIQQDSLRLGKTWFPNLAYGLDSLPRTQPILIKNATVWTNEEAGILKNTSILIQDGKIVEIGEGILDARDAIIIDAEGKHVTSGIIDEHSHIAISGGVNEAGEAIAAEVRLGDVINPDDINIYRQLAGGVTVSQLLHGSADPIGGQSALVKLKWGDGAEDMKFKNAPGFIKFALGENVKQSNWGDYNVVRFPQTRMGVEQIYYDAFIRAREYEASWDAYNKAINKKRNKEKPVKPRKDLELDALLEILKSERFITCHSYVQSEINMLMHVADSMGFTLNTFTHILEGYKVADKMKAHGAGASTFSDWWAYKYEVKDAIPYNAALLNQMGIVTAINSDDAEMARRLNQEAAKAVKYGKASEEDAWKMVTLNPAKLLHIDDRVGSIKVGKDADVVVWSDHPLSIYTKVEKTIIDGKIYYDNSTDQQMRNRNRAERERILKKMMTAIENGEAVRSSQSKKKPSYNCIKATMDNE